MTKSNFHVSKEVIIGLAVGLVIFGILAVQFIRFLAKDSAVKDMDMLDDVRTAILAAMMDPEVIYADDGSKEQIEYLMSPGSKRLTSIESGTKFYDTVIDIMRWNVFNGGEQRVHMRSAPARDDGEIILESTDEQWLMLWIVHSDFDGLGRDYSATDIHSLTNEIVDRSSYSHIHR